MPRGINDYDEGRIQGRNVSNANSSNIVAPGIVTDGLVLHLDAGNYVSYPASGTTWYDLSGYGNNGTLTNGPTYARDGGGSISFDGTNDYASLTNSIYRPQEFSIAIWLYPQTQNVSIVSVADYVHGGSPISNWVVQSEDATTNRYYYLAYGDGSNFQPVGNFGAGKGVQLTTNQWQYLVFTKNGTFVKGYKNSIEAWNVTATSATVSYTATDLNISASSQSSLTRYFNGYIPIFKIYGRALTPTEIAQNFNATRARFNI